MSQLPITKTESVELLARIMRASGWLYMDAYKILDAEFGLEGVMCIRRWMRRWGLWRGNQARKGHMAMGLDVNMVNMLKFWDSAGAIPEANSAEWDMNAWQPGAVRTITNDFPGACEQADLWKEQNFWMGAHVMCDEFHVKYAQGYHPEAICAIPECMMKNDRICYHHFVLPPNFKPAPELPLYDGENPLEDWAQEPADKAIRATLLRKARITAARIYFLKEAVFEMFPERAEEVYDRILKQWCEDRGKDWAEYFRKNDITPKLKNLILDFDQPIAYLCDSEITEEGDSLAIEMKGCPFAETWKWLDAESLQVIQKHYCSQCYSTVVAAGNFNAQAKLTKCELCGDSCCRVEFQKK